MDWLIDIISSGNVEWVISTILLCVTVILSVFISFFMKYKKKSTITPIRVLFIGTFITAMVHFLPVYKIELTAVQTVLNSFQHAFRLFALDGGFMEYKEIFNKIPNGVKEYYLTFTSVLYAFAPLLTFSFILSFFKNLLAHLKYNICFWVPTHVFSELNEKTLALARKVSEKNKSFLFIFPKILIVFMDVVDKKEELSLELIEEAKEIGAILFRKDLESVKFKRKGSMRKVSFYLIGEDEPEKIRHAESIMSHYDFDDVKLKVFSDDIRTELLLAAKDVNNMNVARVNNIQSIIYHNLDEYGKNLFDRARENQNGDKVISAVIVGLGKYGCEMLKALTWYCQLDGYKIKINAYDGNKKALEKIKDMCPELMSDSFNKQIKEGQPYYDISIHSGVDISSAVFAKELSGITDATYIFVCLGNDEKNIKVATQIRSLCERIDYIGDGHKPDIETVIYDSSIRKTMGISWDQLWKSIENRKEHVYGVTNYKKQPYNILMIDDLAHFFADGSDMSSRLVGEARSMHKAYCLDFAKIRFTENHMEKEWADFLAQNALCDAWKKHLDEWKKKKGLSEEACFELPDAISDFNFMTFDEQENAIRNTDKYKSVKNSAAKRINSWEEMVYSKFNEAIKDKDFAAEWKNVEMAETDKAHKSFRYEYNYRSSITKAMHRRLMKKMGIKSDIIGNDWEKMSLDEKIEIGKIEHVRWNAYMRTEGYSYSETRNDLAKLHDKLIPITDLSIDDLRKDV